MAYLLSVSPGPLFSLFRLLMACVPAECWLVMKMNVGYILCVLADVFVGNLAVGRYSALPDH